MTLMNETWLFRQYIIPSKTTHCILYVLIVCLHTCVAYKQGFGLITAATVCCSFPACFIGVMSPSLCGGVSLPD